VIVKELAARLGLEVDLGAFLKAGGMLEFLRVGFDKLIEKSGELVEAFIEQVETVSESGHEIEKTAQVTGLATDELQRLQKAARVAGVESETLNHGIMILSRTMAAAKAGGEEQAKAFKKIGVSYKDGSGNLRSAGDVLKDIGDHFKTLPDGAEKVALSMQLLGRSGAELIPVLNMGGEEIDKIGASAMIMNEEQIEASKDLVLAQKQLKEVTSSLWKSAIYPLIPSIRDLVKQWVAWTKANADLIKQKIGAVLSGALAVIKGLSKALAAMVAMLKFVGEHWRLFAILLGTVVITALLNSEVAVTGLIAKYVALGIESVAAAAKSAAAWVAANGTTALAAGGIALGIAGIVAVVDDLTHALKGEDSLTGDVIASWKTWFRVFDEKFPALRHGWDSFKDGVKGVYDWIVAINQQVEQKFLPLFRMVGDVARKLGVSAQQSSNEYAKNYGGAIANPYFAGTPQGGGGLVGAVRAANQASTMTMAQRQLAVPATSFEARTTTFADKEKNRTELIMKAPTLNATFHTVVQPGQSVEDAVRAQRAEFEQFWHTKMEEGAAGTPANE
jgi:hypothetical protein